MINVSYVMLLVFLVWLPANTIFADEILEASITVQGFVLNGTYEGEVLVNHTVVLHQDISGIHEDLETLSDDSGWFTFDEIVFNPQASYAVSVEYQGVLYGQDLDLSNGSKSDISLVVYDSSDSADILSVSNASVLFSDTENTKDLGSVLYTDYFYLFQLSGLILLVAMIGSIVLTLRERSGVKKQKISEQISVSNLNSIEKKKVKLGEGINV